MGITVNIPGAKESPRMSSDNVIKWYYGDTFEINWCLTLKQKESGETIVYGSDDQLIFSFYKAGTDKLIHRFVCREIDTETNIVSLKFTKNVSIKFKPGRYNFCVKYVYYTDETDDEGNVVTEKATQEITTLGAKYLVEVEECH